MPATSGEDQRLATRDRIMDGVIAVVGDSGLAAVSLEDVAVRAGVSRTTIYRHFDGGRSQLVSETVTREVARFWERLAVTVSGISGLEDQLVMGIMSARRQILDDELLQRLLVREPDEILPAIAESEVLVTTVLVGYLSGLLGGERLRSGLSLTEAASYLARMLLSHIASPGRWDLADEASVRRLVRTQFLAATVDRGPPV